jgi:methyltransferase (TIGR00027 family)
MTLAAPSQTAERVALARAIEALLPEDRRICYDPYARHFLTGRMRRIYHFRPLRKWFCLLSDRRLPGVMGSVLLRTRFMDYYLLERVSSGVKQVVNLGAGYDTRALRFKAQLEAAAVFEVDHPATQERKTATLKGVPKGLPGNLVFIPLRFNREHLRERLVQAGWRPGERTVFIWEGVTYYLAPAAVDRILAFVTDSSAPGSSIVFDFFPPSVADGTSTLKEGKSMQALFTRLGEGLTFGVPPGRMPAFLAQRGFNRVTVFSSRELKLRFAAKQNRPRKVSELFSVVHATVGKAVEKAGPKQEG